MSSSSMGPTYSPWTLPGSYWMMFLSLGVANSSDATEILCLSYLLADPTFLHSFLQNDDTAAGHLAAAVFLGMLLGGLVVGTAGDVYGRRPVLLTGCTVNAVAGMVAALAPHLVVLMTCRFIAGVGLGIDIAPRTDDARNRFVSARQMLAPPACELRSVQ